MGELVRHRGRRDGQASGLRVAVAVLALGLLASVAGPMSGTAAGTASAPLPTTVERRDGRLYAGEGWLEVRDGLTVVHFKGTHRQIGAQNYLLLAREAEELRAAFDPTAQTYEGWEKAVWAFRNAYLKAKIAPGLLRHTPPEFVQEMEGFIEVASGGTVDDLLPVLMASVFQEVELVYGCTSFAAFGPATADGRLLHGRNLDHLALQDVARSGFVAIYEPEGAYPFITVTYPANVGVMHGMNVHGISVSMSYSLATPPNLTTDGIAFMFLLRQVLERASTLDQAVEMILEAPRTVGLNVLVADGKIPDARVIEMAANRYQVRRPENGLIWATNRYETPYMREIQAPGWLASEARDARLRELFTGWHGRFDLRQAAALLRDRDDGPPGQELGGGINNAGTIVTALFDLSRLRMWAGVVTEEGTSADGTLHAFDLSRELGLPPRSLEPLEDVPAVPVDTAEESSWRAVRRAQFLQSSGDQERVLELVEPVLERFPESQVALMLAGRAHLYLGQLEPAGSYFRRLVAQPAPAEPHDLVEAWYWLGRIAEIRGETAEAIAAYQSALAVPLTDVAGEAHRQQEARRRLAALGGAAPAGGGLQVPRVAPIEALEGLPIKNVRILGASRTSMALIESRITLRPGESFRAQEAERTRARLMQLGAFESVVVTPVPLPARTGPEVDALDVIVRVHEGFGWYRDPVERVAAGAADLALNGRLPLQYENLAGKGINLYASYRFGATPASYHLEVEGPAPWFAGMTPSQLSLAWDSAPVEVTPALGARTGDRVQAQVRQATFASDTVWSSTFRTRLGSAWRAEEVEETRDGILLAPRSTEEAALFGSALWSTLDEPSWPTRGHRLEVEASYLHPLAGGTQDFGRMGAAQNVVWPLDADEAWILDLKSEIGRAAATTPLHRRYLPGSQTGLRIAAPALPSRVFVTGGAELIREVSPAVRVGAFAEWGTFGEEGLLGGAEATGATTWTAGGGLLFRYRTPVGITISAHLGVNAEGAITWGVGF